MGLNIIQPAGTARIENSEESLSVEIFERSPAGVRLTKRGKLLLEYEEKFEYLAELVEKDAVDPEGIEGHLRLTRLSLIS